MFYSLLLNPGPKSRSYYRSCDDREGIGSIDNLFPPVRVSSSSTSKYFFFDKYLKIIRLEFCLVTGRTVLRRQYLAGNKCFFGAKAVKSCGKTNHSTFC